MLAESSRLGADGGELEEILGARSVWGHRQGDEETSSRGHRGWKGTCSSGGPVNKSDRIIRWFHNAS